MNKKKEDGNFWALLRIVGKMHAERRKQELEKPIEIVQEELKPSKKPKKRRKRKSNAK